MGPQFQADLSNLHMSRHGEKCKWGWVVGEQREPHSCGERAWCHPARARPQSPWGGTEWGPGTGELGCTHSAVGRQGQGWGLTGVAEPGLQGPASECECNRTRAPGRRGLSTRSRLDPAHSASSPTVCPAGSRRPWSRGDVPPPHLTLRARSTQVACSLCGHLMLGVSLVVMTVPGLILVDTCSWIDGWEAHGGRRWVCGSGSGSHQGPAGAAVAHIRSARGVVLVRFTTVVRVRGGLLWFHSHFSHEAYVPWPLGYVSRGACSEPCLFPGWVVFLLSPCSSIR